MNKSTVVKRRIIFPMGKIVITVNTHKFEKLLKYNNLKYKFEKQIINLIHAFS